MLAEQPQTPSLPPLDMPPLDTAPSLPVDAPSMTLADAAGASALPAPSVAEEPVTPLDGRQIIGVVAEFSAFGLSPEQAEEYKRAFKSNPVVQLGVQLSGLPEALAEYGIGAGGGKLPAWASILIGVGALGVGVYTARRSISESAHDDTGGSAQGAAGPAIHHPAVVAPVPATDLADFPGFPGEAHA